MIFKNIEFTNDEFQLLFSYYESFIQSKEYRLMKLLYNSIPPQVKSAVWKKFKHNKLKQMVLANKVINIEYLNEDITINLGILKEDKELKRPKLLLLQTKYGTIPLCFREYEDILIYNINCTLTIKFFIRNKYNVYKRIN